MIARLQFSSNCVPIARRKCRQDNLRSNAFTQHALVASPALCYLNMSADYVKDVPSSVMSLIKAVVRQVPYAASHFKTVANN